jgi:activator of 2-hydroxyglutaryl-CoA dehydratase
VIVAGVDIGAPTSKTVLLEDSNILSYSIVATGGESADSARQALDEALIRAKLSLTEIGYIVATGYGRVIVPFSQETVDDTGHGGSGLQGDPVRRNGTASELHDER